MMQEQKGATGATGAGVDSLVDYGEPEKLVPRSTDGVVVPRTEQTTKLEDIGKTRRIRTFDSEFEVPTDVTPYPLRIQSQETVVLNLAHKDQRPVHEHPAFRVLGAFATREAAVAFTEQHFGENSKEALYMCPMHQLVPICKSFTSQLSNEYAKTTVDSLVSLHEKMVNDRNAEFKKMVDEQKSGPVGNSMQIQRERARRKRETSAPFQEAREAFMQKTTDFDQVSSDLSAGQQVAQQSYAVVIVMPDIRTASLSGQTELEPLVAVLYCANTQEDAVRYAKYTAAKVYKDCVIDVVDMYRWIFPETVRDDEIASEEYGNSELADIMTARRTNQSKIQEYEKWYEENKKDTDAGPLLLQPTPEQKAAGSAIIEPTQESIQQHNQSA